MCRRLGYVLFGSWHAHPEVRAEVRLVIRVVDQPVDGLWASDHFGVSADLEIDLDR